MRWIHLRNRFSSPSGQGLVETALLLPLILLVVLNAINFGYYYIVSLHLASAPREGVEYAVQGSVAPATPSLPSAGPAATNTSISYLTYQDMQNLSGSSNTPVQVCSVLIGLNDPGLVTQNAQCSTFGPAASPAFPPAAADPESPNFVLHRVDVQYTVTPLIKNMSILGLATPNLTFHRQVSMRKID